MDVARQESRDQTMEKWQKEWDDALNGRWTHRLIPSIRSWTERRHGGLDTTPRSSSLDMGASTRIYTGLKKETMRSAYTADIRKMTLSTHFSCVTDGGGQGASCK